MPPIVPPLNPNSAYIYCPGCRMQGNDGSILSRPDQSGKLICMFGHVYPTWAALQPLNPRMVPMADFQPESINQEAMKYSFFVMPKTMDRLKAKFPQNLNTTVATLLDALSDDSVMILQGSEIAELRKSGMQIKNGIEIIQALKGVKQAEQERDQAIKELDRLHEALKMAGVE